ncbi:MAG: ATP-binding protein [Patescibacteria group bacterium]
MKVFAREIYPTLEKELYTKEAVVITGMRRVGKTTTLRYLYSLISDTNKVIFDLENPLHRKIFEEENYDSIWLNLQNYGISNKTRSYIFIDEIQSLPIISSVVKYLYDHWDVKFFLTGSSSYYLRNFFPESLAGRKLVFEMFPMNFAEFLSVKGVSKTKTPEFSEKANKKNIVAHQQQLAYYEEYLRFGGFPSVILEPDQKRKQLLLEEIFTSYFEKDVQNLADFQNLALLRNLILLLIPRIGSKIEVSKLANDLSVSRPTIYNYLSFLEQTYFISLLPKFSPSIDRRTAGTKKLFLCDVGLANILGQISEGQVFEQSVFQNLRISHKLTFYNNQSGGEVDFIVDEKTALEVKTSFSTKDLNLLSIRVRQIKIDNYFLVTKNYNDHPSIILATDI